MTREALCPELVLLVPDKHLEATMNGLLARPQSLGIRALRTAPEIHVLQESDPGCLRKGADFLRNFVNPFDHALIVFDRHGCGREDESSTALEHEVRRRLQSTGWSDRADVVVLDPELEVWVWTDSPHLEECLGWAGRDPNLRAWLRENHACQLGRDKPNHPKAVLDAALYEVRRPRSSSLFRRLAEQASLKGCQDPAFARLRHILTRWFPL